MAQAEQEQHRQADARGDEVPVLQMQLLRGIHDPRRYHSSLHSDVATVFVANDESAPTQRDSIVHPRDAPRSLSLFFLLM